METLQCGNPCADADAGHFPQNCSESPIKSMGSEAYNATADIWSLGITCIEMAGNLERWTLVEWGCKSKIKGCLEQNTKIGEILEKGS